MYSSQFNFDGSKSASSSAGGFVIKSWDESFLQVGTTNLGAISGLVAEAIAMRNELRVIVQ